MTLVAALISSLEGDFLAFNPETGTTTQGETIAEALENLREGPVAERQAEHLVLSRPAVPEAVAQNPSGVSARIPIAGRWPSPRSESKPAPRN